MIARWYGTSTWKRGEEQQTQKGKCRKANTNIERQRQITEMKQEEKYKWSEIGIQDRMEGEAATGKASGSDVGNGEGEKCNGGRLRKGG